MTAGTGWEIALPAAAELGEHPFWDERERALAWVDVLAGRLHRLRPGAGDEIVVELGAAIGSAAAVDGEGFVLAAADGFRRVNADGRPVWGPLKPRDMPDDARFNDGACDPRGRFFAGTVTGELRPGAGALYRLDPDGSIRAILEGVTESNGLGWSPDGSTFYYVDSGEPVPRIRAFAFDADAGTLGTSRDLVSFDPGDGAVPDGLTIDAEGCLWVAMWGGSEVRRYDADGRLMERHSLPVRRVTCPGFGGERLEDLYVTTAWEGMEAADRRTEPLAGHVFRMRPDARGLPVHRFRDHVAATGWIRTRSED
jgi:sugar lactone lactonase YvrE